MNVVYKRIVTLEEVRRSGAPMIYYGANTCWWTHRAENLSSTAPMDYVVNGELIRGVSLPCDPAGGMLLQTDNVADFLRSAEEALGHYGKHGLTAFEAAHHGNVLVAGQPAAFDSWDSYNEAIDRALASEARP